MMWKSIRQAEAIDCPYSQEGGTTGGNVVVFAVGAVYDRATFASEWAKCAVIDAPTGHQAAITL